MHTVQIYLKIFTSFLACIWWKLAVFIRLRHTVSLHIFFVGILSFWFCLTRILFPHIREYAEWALNLNTLTNSNVFGKNNSGWNLATWWALLMKRREVKNLMQVYLQGLLGGQRVLMCLQQQGQRRDSSLTTVLKKGLNCRNRVTEGTHLCQQGYRRDSSFTAGLKKGLISRNRVKEGPHLLQQGYRRNSPFASGLQKGLIFATGLKKGLIYCNRVKEGPHLLQHG